MHEQINVDDNLRREPGSEKDEEITRERTPTRVARMETHVPVLILINFYMQTLKAYLDLKAELYSFRAQNQQPSYLYTTQFMYISK